MSASILVLCPFGLDAGLVSRAAQISASPLRVLCPHSRREDAARYGAALVHTVPNGFACPDDRAMADWLCGKVTEWGSTVVLAPATVAMRGILPMLAGKLAGGLTADCTGLKLDGDVLVQTRPAFGNRLTADIRTDSTVQLATVRPGTFPPVPSPCEHAEFFEETPVIHSIVKELSFTTYDTETPLAQADIVLAGGMGVGSREGFVRLEAAARRMGAALAASRSAVDAGFAPYRCQVGMTGVTVCPRVYVAVGISGAVQHLAGMSGSGTVIAVNTDPKAPIFDYADYGFVGDWETLMQELEVLL